MADITSLNFDASQVEPAKAMEALPAGSYVCVATKSEMKENKTKTGVYLEVEYQIVAGEHSGRKLWDRINLVNQSTAAVEIGRRTFSALCRAVNVLRPTDTEQLHNIPLVLKVGLEKRQDTGELANTVKGYEPTETAGSAPAAQAAPAAAAGGKPSWAR